MQHHLTWTTTCPDKLQQLITQNTALWLLILDFFQVSSSRTFILSVWTGDVDQHSLIMQSDFSKTVCTPIIPSNYNQKECIGSLTKFIFKLSRQFTAKFEPVNIVGLKRFQCWKLFFEQKSQSLIKSQSFTFPMLILFKLEKRQK